MQSAIQKRLFAGISILIVAALVLVFNVTMLSHIGSKGSESLPIFSHSESGKEITVYGNPSSSNATYRKDSRIPIREARNVIQDALDRKGDSVSISNPQEDFYLDVLPSDEPGEVGWSLELTLNSEDRWRTRNEIENFMSKATYVRTDQAFKGNRSNDPQAVFRISGADKDSIARMCSDLLTSVFQFGLDDEVNVTLLSHHP